MGCSICNLGSKAQEESFNDSSFNRALSNRPTLKGYRSQRPKKSIKLKNSNYVQMTKGALEEMYLLEEKVGEGGFGSVYKAFHKGLRQYRAIKTLDRSSFPSIMRKQLLSEVFMLKEMDHPNILKIYEVIKEPNYYHIVTELLTGGELFDSIIKGVRLSEQRVAAYMQQILSAIQYCHEKRIVHRDIKPENLILENNTESAMVKVIDFGTSCLYGENMTDVVGTSYYIAPEILASNLYDEKCDVWSCGIILYILLCGFPPFNGTSDKKISKSIMRDQLVFPDPEWSHVSSEAKNMVKFMLNKNPKKRPSALEVLEHSWLRKRTALPTTDNEVDIHVLNNLKNFKAGNNLRKAVLHMITSQFISLDKLEEKRRIFMSLDVNKDGKLSREELIDGFNRLQIGTTSEVDRIMEIFDTKESGYIEFTEFLTATLDWKLILDRETLESAFKAFDIDGDGLISAKELKYMLNDADTDEETDDSMWDDMIKEGDTNSDGALNIEEFRRMMIRRFTTKLSENIH